MVHLGTIDPFYTTLCFRLPFGGRNTFTSAPAKRGFSPQFLEPSPLFYFQEPISTRDFSYDNFDAYAENDSDQFESSSVGDSLANQNLAVKRAMSSRTLDNDPFGIMYRSYEKRSWPDAEYLDDNYFKPMH